MPRVADFVRNRLKPRHLRLLLALDKLRSISKVAEALCVSQPAVSKTLHELEEGLGIQLFERKHRTLVPTPFGACLIGYAGTILEELENAGHAMAQLIDRDLQIVRAGILPGSFLSILPRALVHFRNRNPHMRVSINSGAMDAHFRALRDDRLDVVLGMTAERAPPADMTVTPLFETHFVLVVGSHGELARKRAVTTDDLQRAPWILPQAGLPFRRIADRLLRAIGVGEPASLVEVSSHELMFSLLREMGAAAFVTNYNAQHFARMGFVKILPVELPAEALPVCAYTLTGAAPNPAVNGLVIAVQQSISG